MKRVDLSFQTKSCEYGTCSSRKQTLLQIKILSVFSGNVISMNEGLIDLLTEMSMHTMFCFGLVIL